MLGLVIGNWIYRLIKSRIINKTRTIHSETIQPEDRIILTNDAEIVEVPEYSVVKNVVIHKRLYKQKEYDKVKNHYCDMWAKALVDKFSKAALNSYKYEIEVSEDINFSDDNINKIVFGQSMEWREFAKENLILEQVLANVKAKLSEKGYDKISVRFSFKELLLKVVISDSETETPS